MQKLLFLIAIVIAVGFIAYSNRLVGATPTPVISFQEDKMSELKSDWIRGKSLRWTFADGPMAGTPFEHTFNEDGVGRLACRRRADEGELGQREGVRGR